MKFNITQTFIDYIKDLRKERGIKNKDLSQAMGKTDSYITKLDSGGIKTIDPEDFDKLFAGIEPDPSEAENLKDGYFLLLIKDGLIDNSIQLNLDLYNYACVYKQLPFPADVIKHLNRMLTRNNITVDDVVSLLNRNLPVAGYYGFAQAPENEYLPIPAEHVVPSNNKDSNDSGNSGDIYMKLRLDPARMAAIMAGEMDLVYHYEIQALALGIMAHDYTRYFKIDNVETVMQNTEHSGTVLVSSQDFLFNHHFYSLADTRRREHSQKLREDASETLMQLPHNIQTALYRYTLLTDRVYKQDAFYAEARMKRLGLNLHEVPSLVFALNGLPYYKLKKLQTENRRAFLSDLEKLIEKYASDSDLAGEMELL